jgi:hypothetical protein
MMKFAYSATVNGQEIQTDSVKSLADQINAIYEYPRHLCSFLFREEVFHFSHCRFDTPLPSCKQ